MESPSAHADDLSFTRSFLSRFLCSFGHPSLTFKAYHLESGGMPLHDAVGINCKKKVKIPMTRRRCRVHAPRCECWILLLLKKVGSARLRVKCQISHIGCQISHIRGCGFVCEYQRVKLCGCECQCKKIRECEYQLVDIRRRGCEYL